MTAGIGAANGRPVIRGYRRALRIALSGETKAYGFTLVVWGTGAIMVGDHGQPAAAGAVSFIGGTLGAMALVLVVAFVGSSEEPRRPSQHLGLGGLHV